MRVSKPSDFSFPQDISEIVGSPRGRAKSTLSDEAIAAVDTWHAAGFSIRQITAALKKTGLADTGETRVFKIIHRNEE